MYFPMNQKFIALWYTEWRNWSLVFVPQEPFYTVVHSSKSSFVSQLFIQAHVLWQFQLLFFCESNDILV